MKTTWTILFAIPLLGCGFNGSLDGDFGALPPADPTCADGQENGGESDVDCGGDCAPCVTDAHCQTDADCASLACVTGVCQPPTCNDERRNGTESDLDCGGGCPACAGGSACGAPEDCQSEVCEQGLCQAIGCDDGERNQDETDVDCGGLCVPCDNGGTCADGGDCKSDICTNGVCTGPGCADGAKNQDESDVDCGGSCAPCADGASCGVAADCASGVCEAGVCLAPTCTDELANGDESDADCGGSCPSCADGLGCGSASDCASGVCSAGACQSTSCVDLVKNGGESDVDCGGPCGLCADGLACGSGSDCASDVCAGGACQSPSCQDGAVNGGESGVDCGGASACADCPAGKACTTGLDCLSLVCSGGSCAAATCLDLVKNGGESDVDCGGPCGACRVGASCAVDADCGGGTCQGFVCVAPPSGLWTKVFGNAGAPHAKFWSAAAFDPTSNQPLITGGFFIGGGILSEAWLWNGTLAQWSSSTPSPNPMTARTGHVLTSISGSLGTGVLLFGGYTTDNGLSSNDTWVWANGAWTPRSPAQKPLARDFAAGAYHAGTGEVVIFGGENGTTALPDTWTYGGGDWQQKPACGEGAPPARVFHAMAYDENRGRVVLFGGSPQYLPASPFPDTWEWDGSCWSPTTPTTSPPARGFGAMAYDADRKRVVLTCGKDTLTGSGLADTWEWDGLTWTQVATLGGSHPMALQMGNVLVYDVGRKRMVLQTSGPSESAAETWEFTALAGACATNADCGSAFCVDGVCCAQAACGTCEACNTGASAGLCAPILNGKDGDSCAGTCDAQGFCG